MRSARLSPPTSAVLTPAPGIATCTDSNKSTSPGVLDTTVVGTFSYTVLATSTDGQSGSAIVSYTVAGVPTATITSPATGHTYAVSQVVATNFSCADPTGPGIATCTDSDNSTSPGVLDTTVVGTFSYTVLATSTDGQSGSAIVSYTVAGVPTATITSPATGHTYAVSQVVATNFSCADPTGPGIATCTDSNNSTSPGVLDTTVVGTFSYTVLATSTDGQSGSAIVSYTVAGVPTATITSPATGHTYAVSQVVATNFSCADPTPASRLAPTPTNFDLPGSARHHRGRHLQLHGARHEHRRPVRVGDCQLHRGRRAHGHHHQPSFGPDRRWHTGDHYRDQLHRLDRGCIWLRCCHKYPHRQRFHDSRDKSGQSGGSSQCDSHDLGWHIGSESR